MRQNILNWNCFLECFQAVIALDRRRYQLLRSDDGYLVRFNLDLLFVALSAGNGNDLDRVGARVQQETLHRVIELPEFID
jgi:hypothetical protein